MFPAKPVHLSLYFIYLVQQAGSCSPVTQASAALSWLHRKAALEDPSSHQTVCQLRTAIRRLTSRATVRHCPLTLEDYYKLLDILARPSASLSDIQCAALIALGFTAMLRWNDLQNLRSKHITFYPTHMSVLLEQRKNDQFRNGQTVVVCRTGHHSHCPVKVLARFLEKGAHQPDDCLFRRVTVSPIHGDFLRGVMSYTRARELLLAAFQRAGLDTHRVGTHSLRSGGATAASSAGIPDHLLQQHGGWRCSSSKDCYIDDNLECLLSVSRAILDTK